MTTEYAAFYKRNNLLELDMNEPVGVIKYEDGVVTLTGDERFVTMWEPYFSSQDGWGRYVVESEKPLNDFMTRSTYSMGQMLDGDTAEYRYRQIVDDMRSVQTVTVTSKKPTKKTKRRPA